MKVVLSILLFVVFVLAQELPNPYRNVLVMNGNDITVSVYNYGSYSNAGNHETDFVWHGLGYAYECGFFFGAEVPVPKGSHADVFKVVNGDSVQYFAHVISDGFTSNGPELNPERTLRWGLNAIRFNYDSSRVYLDPDRFDHLPHFPAQDFNLDGLPDLWPDAWFNPTANAFEWPGIWKNGQAVGDLETVYGMDDRDNKEFAYYPFPQDSNRQGLGIEAEVHPIQVQDFYQDILFAVIKLRNVSAYDLKKMLFGFAADPHIGGWSDYRDDHYGYDRSENLIYFFDTDHKSIYPGVEPGYFGVVFLQTPGNSTDGIDNDGDGMVDESQWDGIDNDGDWDAQRDDVGADGIPGTGDFGEGDGQPTLGEPNFEYTDMDEADMVGMTSAAYATYGSLYMRDDEKIWQKTTPGYFDPDKEGDRMGLAGCGYFDLPAGETARIGVAFVFGKDLDDLLDNVHRAKRLYAARMGNYKLTEEMRLSDTLCGKRFEQTIPLKWNASDLPNDATLECAVSADNGKHWQPVMENIPNTGAVDLDVSAMPSKPFYKMRLRGFSKEAYFQYQTDGYFAIDNSGSENVAPDLLVDLNDNDILSEKALLTWRAGDVDGDALHTFLVIHSEVINDTLALNGDSLWLYTRNYPNGPYQFIFTTNDDQSTVTVTRNIFIQNTYDMAEQTLLQHLQGPATGQVAVQLVNSADFKYHLYKVTFTFDDDQTFYSVTDSTSGEVLIDNDPLPANGNAGRTFNGFRLVFENHSPSLDEAHTGWNAQAKTNLNFTVRKNGTQVFPYDIELRFYDHVVDTSLFKKAPLNFTAENLTTGEKPGIFVPDSTGWQPERPIILTESKKDWTKLWTLKGTFPENSEHINPSAGDVFTIRTFKPFADQDVYLFDATPLTGVENVRGVLPQKFALQQNFPNPFNPQTTIRFTIAQSGPVKLTVFNVLGQKVKTLIDAPMQAGAHQVTFDGRNLASGIYWYRLQANGRVKVRKMVLLK